MGWVSVRVADSKPGRINALTPGTFAQPPLAHRTKKAWAFLVQSGCCNWGKAAQHSRNVCAAAAGSQDQKGMSLLGAEGLLQLRTSVPNGVATATAASQHNITAAHTLPYTHIHACPAHPLPCAPLA